MTKPVVAVVSGYGLMRVVGRDPGVAYEVVGHGTQKRPGHWFVRERVRVLSEDEARAAVHRERREAGARGVACNSPGCWCLSFGVADSPGDH